MVTSLKVQALHGFVGSPGSNKLSFQAGDTLYVLDEQGRAAGHEWLWGQTEDGALGWLAASYVAEDPTSTAHDG